MSNMVSIYAGLFLILASSTSGAIISSAADPALSGATVDNFSSYPIGDPAFISDGVFTMTEIASADRVPPPYLSVRDTFNGQYGIVGRSVINFNGTPIKIAFADAVSAFGVHIGATDVGIIWTLEAFNPVGTSLGSGTVLVDLNARTNGFYFGWSDISIGSIVLTPSATDNAILDNLAYVVPEPATSALLIGLAAGALLCFRRLHRDPVA